jgi:hypothetical protein
MHALLVVPLQRGFQTFNVYLCDTCADPFVLATRHFLWPDHSSRHFCDKHAEQARADLKALKADVDDVACLGQPISQPVAVVPVVAVVAA